MEFDEAHKYDDDELSAPLSQNYLPIGHFQHIPNENLNKRGRVAIEK